jgi:hypothetical protein
MGDNSLRRCGCKKANETLFLCRCRRRGARGQQQRKAKVAAQPASTHKHTHTHGLDARARSDISLAELGGGGLLDNKHPPHPSLAYL